MFHKELRSLPSSSLALSIAGVASIPEVHLHAFNVTLPGLAWWILFNSVPGSCVPLRLESRAGDPVLSPVAPLCGLGCGPVASRLRAAVCLLLPCRSPAPGPNSPCRAHRGRTQKGTVWDTDEWHRHDATICKANTAF